MCQFVPPRVWEKSTTTPNQMAVMSESKGFSIYLTIKKHSIKGSPAQKLKSFSNSVWVGFELNQSAVCSGFDGQTSSSSNAVYSMLLRHCCALAGTPI